MPRSTSAFATQPSLLTWTQLVACVLFDQHVRAAWCGQRPWANTPLPPLPPTPQAFHNPSLGQLPDGIGCALPLPRRGVPHFMTI